MSQPKYPLLKYSFNVEWGGVNIGFTEVSGLDMEVDLVEYRQGASPDSSSIKMPGRRKFSNVTMKRGTFEGDNEFYQWYNQNRINGTQRRDITIQLLNENQDPVVSWKLTSAFVLKLQTTDLKADGSEVAIESIELAHEGLAIENA